jgi:AcrR family transcriptional regulator
MKRTRAALCSAMLSLVEERAFDEISIRDVTERAQVGYATFFRNYDNVRAVLRDLIEDQIRQVIELTVPAIENTKGGAAALALCAFVEQRRKLWTALLTGGAAGIVREEFTRQGAQLRTTLPRRDWLPVELANIFAVSGIVEILTWWLQRGPGLTADEVARMVERLVISSFVRGDGDD